MANQHKQLKPHLLKKQFFANSNQAKQEAHAHHFGGVMGQEMTARNDSVPC